MAVFRSCFFFFQAEDGIRDYKVTGVQTCALPILEGKSTYVFELADGRQVKGSDLQQHRDWPWRHSPQAPEVRYARLRATSLTYGAVTLIVISEPKEEQYYIMCLDTAINGPRLIRAWKRRHWIEY